GYPHEPKDVENSELGAPNKWPGVGAVINKLRQAGSRNLPAAVTLPEHIWNTGGITWPGQDAGYLGRAADPWLLMCVPSRAGFQVPELGLPSEVPPLRLRGRHSLLEQVNRHLDIVDRSGAMSR